VRESQRKAIINKYLIYSNSLRYLIKLTVKKQPFNHGVVSYSTQQISKFSVAYLLLVTICDLLDDIYRLF